MNFHNKHYIRIDVNSYVVRGFSDAFEQPLETDICINEEGGRQFELNEEVNPPLIDMATCHLYKYEDGSIIETTEEERLAELASFPIIVVADPQAEYLIELDYRISKIELGV